MTKLFTAAIVLLTSYGLSLAASPPPALYGRLTVNNSHIVFSYAGDLWAVERSGGEARRLTSHPGEESFPFFSPDGSQLAFSRQSGSNWDVYVMPASVGETKRMTYHPQSDFAAGWSPDGKRVLFESNRSSVFRLYTIEIGGSMPVELPFPYGSSGSFSPDGGRLAYTPRPGVRDWRYYRGGGVGQVWIADLRNGASERLSQGDHNEDFPNWVGDKVYLVSDRSATLNLYCYDVSSRQTKQITSFEQHGIRAAAAGGGVVAFVRDGRIHLYDPSREQTQVIDVRVRPETAELQPRTTNVARIVEWASLSASGDRVVFGARGEVLLFDPAAGGSRNITGTPGVAERYPAMSADGRWFAYFSDESGEYQLHVQPFEGEAPVKKITIEPRPSFYRELVWSPDSKKVAFTDKRLALWVADVESGKTARIDTSTYSYQEEWRPVWSHDGRWLAYSKHLPNRVRTVFVYDFGRRQVKQITDGRTHSELPVFDSGGKYLYFASSPNAGTSEYGWGVLNGMLARPLVSRRLHAVVLQEGGPPPLLPSGIPNAEAWSGEPVATVRIDFEGINRRVVDLPGPPRDYAQLVAGRPGVLYALVLEWPPAPLSGNTSQVLYRCDVARSARLEKIVEGVDGFELSGDGSSLLYAKQRNWFIVGAGGAPKADEGKLDLKKLEVNVDPRAEWRQIYHEAWRIMRDWFYDSNHHGQELAELERHYAEYLPSITRRVDLNSLMNRMLGHISVSHLGVGGGDVPAPAPGTGVGMLGADYEVVENRYRLKHVYRATSYNSPVGSVQAPLDWLGVNVREGEYLLAVESQQIDASKSVYSYFEGKSAGALKITVGPKPDGEGARALTVFPVQNEANLRIANWAAENRRRVEQASGGKLGYIYVGNFGQAGIMDFIRGLGGYSDLLGVVIDQRFNGGGITPDYLIEWLQRRPLYYYTFREGDDIATPVNPGPAVKVLIVNEQNFSAAETFAFMYKLGRVGPIVGKRTGGGGIGPYVFTPSLIDGGGVRLPNRAAYNPDGSSWGIENVGITPDFEVDIMPKDFIAGRDPQLEKAIQVAIEQIKKIPASDKRKPRYPVHR